MLKQCINMIQYLVPLFFADPAMRKGKGGMLKEKALRQKKTMETSLTTLPLPLL